jgi:hypothetical protein
MISNDHGIYISLRNYNYNLTQSVHAQSLDGSLQSNFYSDQISKMAATPSTFFFNVGSVWENK